MKTAIKEFIEKIKGLWNIYGGVGMSILIGWFTKWSKSSMEAWAAYLTLLITCIGLLTFFKVLLLRQKKTKLDAVSFSSNKNLKKMGTALYPEETGEEIGTAIITTLKGGKLMKNKIVNLIKLWWGNKFTVLSLLLNLAYTGLSQYLLYSDSLKEIPFFNENKLLCIIVATSVSVLWLVLELYKDIKNYGFESIETLKEKWAIRRAEKENQLTPEQKKVVKNTISEIKIQIKGFDNKLKEITDKLSRVNSVINNINSLRKIGIPITDSQNNEYNIAVNEAAVLERSKADVENQKNAINSELSKLKAKL